MSRRKVPQNSSLLRRIQAMGEIAYVPSVPGECEEEEVETKRGRKRSRGDDRVQTFSEKSKETKEIMSKQMASIALSLEQRRIVPTDSEDYRRLVEKELATMDMSGAASTSIFKPDITTFSAITPASMQLIRSKRPDGHYDMLEFAEIMSNGAATSSILGEDNNSRNAISTNGVHTHETRDTRLNLLSHANTHHKDFSTKPFFVYKLFDVNSASLATLMCCSQHNSAENWMEQLRLSEDATSHSTEKWMSLLSQECGLHFFCAYVSSKSDHVALVVCADNANRYFLVLMMSQKNKKAPVCIEVASQTWNKEANEEYRKRIENTETARDTTRPCVGHLNGDSAKPRFWAIYNMSMCNSLAQTPLVFEYAYYTTCQCVDTTAPS